MGSPDPTQVVPQFSQLIDGWMLLLEYHLEESARLILSVACVPQHIARHPMTLINMKFWPDQPSTITPTKWIVSCYTSKFLTVSFIQVNTG
jgi:hypothetical protein